MTALKSPPQHFPALDGLRGVAILAVIIYHNFPYGESLFGWLGVDLFFVLSGFLITSILMRSVRPEPGKGFLKKFYIRRALRIFPLYYLFLLLFLFLLPQAGIWKNEVNDYVENKWWFIFYLQNWLLATDFPDSSQCLNHFWSLAVEEQYYLIWPFVILLLRTPKRLVAFLIGVLVMLFIGRSFIWHQQYAGFNYTTFYLFTRFDGICIGSLVALLVTIRKDFLSRHTAVIVTGLALLNFIFYFLNKNGQLPYWSFLGYTTFASMFGFLVYELCYGETGWLKNIFSISPLRFLGKISYGIYMFHWPIHFLLRKNITGFYIELFRWSGSYTAILTGLTTTLIAILLSWFSYKFFESRFLKLKEKFN
jgi:peptidoglycan/LPS O-acetylase OafA/YrhL